MENLHMSKETFKEIMSTFKGLILDSTDLEDAFDLIRYLFEAEAKATREKEPYATRTIAEYEAAAVRLSFDCSDFCEMYDEVMGG